MNVSLHGAPDDPRARAIGTALLHLPDVGWVGERRGARAVGGARRGGQRGAVADGAGGRLPVGTRARLGAVLPRDALALRLTAQAAAPAIDIEQQLPFGPGWVSWYVVPRLTVSGELTVGSRRIDLAHASAYHDHNWGRWYWGDDVGWEWGAFLTPAPGPAFVLSRATDRQHRRVGNPVLIVQRGSRRRTFGGRTVAIDYAGQLDGRLRRLPGALAALHQDRATPRLPARVTVRANDGRDRVEIVFTARAAAQLIAGDPAVRGYGFCTRWPARSSPADGSATTTSAAAVSRCSSMSTEAYPDAPLSLAGYVEALVAALGDADPEAVARLRRVVGAAPRPHRARRRRDRRGVRGRSARGRSGRRRTRPRRGRHRPRDRARSPGRASRGDRRDPRRTASGSAARPTPTVRMFTAIEILLDAAPRAPALQALAAHFRRHPLSAPRSEPVAGGSRAPHGVVSRRAARSRGRAARAARPPAR